MPERRSRAKPLSRPPSRQQEAITQVRQKALADQMRKAKKADADHLNKDLKNMIQTDFSKIPSVTSEDKNAKDLIAARERPSRLHVEDILTQPMKVTFYTSYHVSTHETYENKGIQVTAAAYVPLCKETANLALRSLARGSSRRYFSSEAFEEIKRTLIFDDEAAESKVRILLLKYGISDSGEVEKCLDILHDREFLPGRDMERFYQTMHLKDRINPKTGDTYKPKEIARLGLHKAFVVTDKDLIKYGVADKVLSVLKSAGIPYEIFSEIKQNPTVFNVKTGVKAFAESGADFILAIGGGSSIDSAKAVGIISNNPEFSDVVSLEGVADTKKKSVPIIALPTTAGTAAEVTINYVITDEANEKKMVCVDPNDIPAIAIVDAELMYTLPKSLTASTGLDALTHAIEGLITKGAWEMSDMFEIKAIEMIARYLETAVNEPTNAEARNGMAVAQYIAGMAFSNVGLGVVHGMAHPLGAIFDIPHGVANALLLPVIMEFNAPAALDKYVDIAKAMNVYTSGMSREEAAHAAVEAVKSLAIRVGIPQHLSELGIEEEDLERLSEAAFADVCTPGNPREVSKEIILELYRKAL